jgi:hypothetical protein
MRTSMLLLLSFSACVPAETGIDHTIVHGTLTIPPVTATEGRGNDDVASAQPLGPDGATGLTWRSVVVTGAIDAWPQGLADPDGDPDSFAFTPVADGTYTFGLSFSTATTTADTASGGSDADVLTLQIVDPAAYNENTGAGVLWEGTTDGSGGAFTASYDVTGGATYVLRILPNATDAADEALPYTLLLSGSAPDDTTILVGA